MNFFSATGRYSNRHRNLEFKVTTTFIISTLIALVGIFTGCQSITDRRNVRPLVLRDVPAQRLAYRFEADTNPPPEASREETTDKLEAIQTDFNTRRPDDALLRTVVSPDNQRALALYGTESEPSSAFRIDLYSVDGKFLRNLTPPDLSGVFPETVSWSTDSNFIAFIGHRGVKPTPSPTPVDVSPESLPEALPSPSVGPAFAPVALFNTEQIYICNRDGLDLRALTSREGLIYFYFAWAPDNHGLVALACREGEWDARAREYKLPAGRPRLLQLDGKERLLDDGMTEALPVWSPDSSKVATAFDTDVAIYDASGNPATQARVPLREVSIKAAIAFEEKGMKKTEGEAPGAEPAGLPVSFNPIVRLEWATPEMLYFQTAYVRLIPNDPINTFQRWHRLILSAQAAVLK